MLSYSKRHTVYGVILALLITALVVSIAWAASSGTYWAKDNLIVGPLMDTVLDIDNVRGTTKFQQAVVVNTDGSETLTADQSGNTIYCTYASGTTTIAIPAPSADLVGCRWTIVQSADQDLKITSAGGDDTDSFLTLNSVDSDYGTFTTATELIGATAEVICVSSTLNALIPLQGTCTVTDTD